MHAMPTCLFRENESITSAFVLAWKGKGKGDGGGGGKGGAANL